MTNKNSKVDIFVKDIDVYVGLILFWYALWHKVGKIHFVSIQGLGGWLLNVVLRTNRCQSIVQLETDLSSSMPKGGGLWYWIEACLRDLSDKITENITTGENFLDHIDDRIDPRRRVTALKKLLDGELYWVVTLALLAKQVNHEAQEACACVVFDRFSPPAALINRYIGVVNPGAIVKRLPALKNRIIVRLLWFVYQQIGFLVRGWVSRSTSSSTKKQPSVAIQFAWGIDSASRVNDLWWFRQSGLDPSQLVVFFNRKRNPATESQIQKIVERGYRYSILEHHSNQSVTNPTNDYPSYRARWALADLTNLLTTPSWLNDTKFPWWQVGEWAKILLRLRKWQAFMTAENIKVIFDVVETTVDVASLCADIVGAIKIGTHWSDVSYNRTRVFPTHQVYFIWGGAQEEVFADLSPASAFVQIGNIFNDAERRVEIRNQAAEYRQRLEQNGVEFVVGVLDRTYSSSSHVPPPYHVEFYDRLIALAETDPTRGLLIKPKKIPLPPLFEDYPEFLDRIRNLEKRGQAILIDGSGHVCAAGFASDVVVALGINSGGLLCALEAIPTVFWDPTNSKGSPLSSQMRKFGWENEQVVYSDFDQLIAALDSPVGDFSEFVDSIDSFQDGQATLRVGKFVGDFIQAIAIDENHQTALNVAIDRYIQQWGQDKVSIKK